MHILVAGGAGFLGSHLVDALLAAGHKVIALDNLITGHWDNLSHVNEHPRLSCIEADITAPLPDLPPLSQIFHLASPASPKAYRAHPLATLDAGSLGTRHLLRLAAQHHARFLLASTSEVYGDPCEHPQRETYRGNVDPTGPRSVYDEAKRFAEALTTAWGQYRGVEVRIARLFNTYGPRMGLDDGRMIPTFVCQALTGVPLTVFGDGSQTRACCFVDDTVAGLLALMASDLQGPCNLGNPDEISVRALAVRILGLLHSDVDLVFRPLPQDDPQRRCPDITRALSIGWAPSVVLDDGLLRTAAWAREVLARV